MRPWMGAAAIAAAMLLTPSAALAGEDDPALIQFKLPNSAAYEDFESLGLNMDHAVENGGGDSIIVSAWATDQEKALAEARGYRAVNVVHDKFNIDRIREERNQSIADEKAAKRALAENAAGKAGKSAAPGTVRAQRGDFWENNVGRFISIEANTTRPRSPARTRRPAPLLLHRPGPDRGVVRRHGQADGRGQPDDLHRHRRQPRLLPVPLPGLPDRQQGRRRP